MLSAILTLTLAQAALAVPVGNVEPAPPIVASPHLVAAGTPVQLMVINEVSTRDAKPGTRFVVQVSAPLMLGERVAIPAGVAGVGEVTHASTSGVGGRSGKLATRLLYLDVGTRRVALNGDSSSAGQGAGAQMVLMTVLINPVGVFTRGNNAKLKAGQIITGTIGEAFDLDATVTPTPP